MSISVYIWDLTLTFIGEGEGKEKEASLQTVVCREMMSPLASHNTSWNPLVFKVSNTYFLYVCYRGLKLDATSFLEILEVFLRG